MCGFWLQNSDFRARITSLCRWIDPTCGFCMQNSDFWTRITSLCGSQTSPVIFCMQNSVPSFRNTSLHGPQPSRVVFGCKTATYGPEKQVSMGPRHDLSFCRSKTAWLASEILVSMGRSPHVWFLDAKQRILVQNFKSLWVPALICGFCIQNSEFWPRITSLYGSQTSPAHLCNQNGLICTRISSLYWFQPSSVVFACKTAWLASESLVSMGPSPYVWFLDAKQRLLEPNNKSLRVPDITYRCVNAIQRD